MSNIQKEKIRLEARVGIEPTHKGFADLSLTTWVPRPNAEACKQIIAYRKKVQLAKSACNVSPHDWQTKEKARCSWAFCCSGLERETGFEPATSTLARSHSTTELLPLGRDDYK